MPEIPEKLKWYTPLGLGSFAYSHFPPPWKIIADELTSCVEIKRTPLIRIFTVAAALGMTAMAIALGTLVGLLFYLFDPEDQEVFILVRDLPNEFFIFLFSVVRRKASCVEN